MIDEKMSKRIHGLGGLKPLPGLLNRMLIKIFKMEEFL
jgi:hypothetical protein